MVKEDSIVIRSQAVGMLQAGSSQRWVSLKLGVNIRTIRRWWRLFKNEISLKNQGARGRKSSVPRIAEIIISKSIGKKRRSVRNLSRQLKLKGHQVSSSTVYRYLTKVKGVKSFKRQRQPLLTQKHKDARLKFCKEHANWTVKDWRNILFSDESPFQLNHPSNRKNDCVWAKNPSEEDPIQMVKFPKKIQVWGLMSHSALSNLHFIPPGQTVTADYYIKEILQKTLMSAFNRRREKGTVLQRKMLQKMSGAVFQQDGAPAHNAKITHDWLRKNVTSFWAKATWPANSPDLSPIENLWSILKDDLDSKGGSKDLKMLEKQIKIAWSNISPENLGRLIVWMPNRIIKCIELRGDI